jgi:tyrosyl-DNA phosphodiesterase 2
MISFVHVNGPPSPISCLQEVTPIVRDSILEDARVQRAFFVTHAEDDASFEGVPFTTMTLLARKRFFAAGHDSHQEGHKVEGGDKLMLGPVLRLLSPAKTKKRTMH